jgi:hypothetical protein
MMLRHLGRGEGRPRERKRHEDTGREMKDRVDSSFMTEDSSEKDSNGENGGGRRR